MKTFSNIDYLIFGCYFLIVSAYGLWVYRRKKKQAISGSHDFFLAEGSLTWWAIGASLIASNISAEQFIGASGQGFTVGIAVAAYEWIAAIALIIVAVWFIPVYLKNKIFTMPQFLQTRYNETVALIMAIFWLFLYVFVNLTSILYLGAICIDSLAGGGHFHFIIIALAVFAFFIALGGMKVIGYTDVIQVSVLIIGGLATTFIAVKLAGGWDVMLHDAPDHFHLILLKPTAATPQGEINKYLLLPGIGMYLAGQWIVNLNYWGCNQYITQRALGADLKTARTGILFAGLLKLAMPIIVILPGIAAYVAYHRGALQSQMLTGGKLNGDNAYSAVLSLLPSGLKGLSIAALTAAIVASLAGKANSISTIFSLDIYQKYFGRSSGDEKVVRVGKFVVAGSLLVAIIFTWQDTLGIGGAGGFTFIQKYTGFISPGIFAIFILGFFWKRTTGAAAITGILSGFLLSVLFNNYAPQLFGHETWLYTAFPSGKGGYEIPFLICMGLSFGLTMILMVLVSFLGTNTKYFDLTGINFKVEKSTLALIVVTILLLGVLYVRFW